MADIELKDALQMFSQGAQQLMMSRAIQGANEQVQQIRDQEADGAKQLTQIRQVANGLTMRMASIGVPETTMAAVRDSFGKTDFNNANSMNAYALESGNSALGEMAKKQQEFEVNQQAKLELVKARAQNGMLNAQASRDQKQKQFVTTQFTKLADDLDETKASGRSAFGIAGVTGQKAERMRALIGRPENTIDASKGELVLVAEGLANLVKNGVATETEIRALVPNTKGMAFAQLTQALSDKPESAHVEGFLNRYKEIVSREKSQADSFVTKTVLKRASARLKLTDLDEGQFKLTVAKSLEDSLGREISPDEIRIDKKKGVYLKETSAPTKTPSAPEQNLIERKTKDGRTALYDSSKKFLRYK